MPSAAVHRIERRRSREIVGVVGNVQQRGGFQNFGPIDALPGIYMPFSQFPAGGLRTIHGWFSTAWIIRQTHDGAVTEPTTAPRDGGSRSAARGVGRSRR